MSQPDATRSAASGHRSREYERIYTLWITLPSYVRLVYPWFIPAHKVAA